MKFGYNRSHVSEEKTISSPGAFGSGELKISYKYEVISSNVIIVIMNGCFKGKQLILNFAYFFPQEYSDS